MAPSHPKVRIVSDGTEYGVGAPIGEPGERAFRAGVALANEGFENAGLIADAFMLACTPAYISKAMGEVLPFGWTGIAADMVKGLASDIMWVVKGAAIGATFGAALGMLLPPAEPLTLAGGAALGASIATWALVGIGIVGAVKMTITISQAAATLFGEGVRLALARQKERAAQMFARALALILGAVVPLAIVMVLTRAGGRMIQAQTTRFLIARVTRMIRASRIVTAAEARAVGLLGEEAQAIGQATRGLFYIFRGCNPNRVAAMERNGGIGGVHFKPGYLVDFKSAKVGIAGEYAIEKGELQAYLKGFYKMKREGNRWRLEAEAGAFDGKSTTPYLDRTNPRTGGPWLDGHLLEEVMIDGKPHYALKHPDGKPFVPDIDRLLYCEIGQTGRLGRSGVLRGKNWLANDDPREVSYWNTMISRALRKIMGEPVDWRGIQHGKSADYTKPHKITGEVGPGWPSRNDAGEYMIPNEAIVIGIDGQLFVTDWHGLATFCKSLELLHFKFPWAKAIIQG
jgi:hypothetical protein